MKQLFFFTLAIILSLVLSDEVSAQRSSVSTKEITGTFVTANENAEQNNEIKIASAGKLIGLPHIKVEILASIRRGLDDNARGNTGELSGIAPIFEDRANFVPPGMTADECTIIIHFVKDGEVNVTQTGTCKFISDAITLSGDYKKKDNKKPQFSGK